MDIFQYPSVQNWTVLNIKEKRNQISEYQKSIHQHWLGYPLKNVCLFLEKRSRGSVRQPQPPQISYSLIILIWNSYKCGIAMGSSRVETRAVRVLVRVESGRFRRQTLTSGVQQGARPHETPPERQSLYFMFLSGPVQSTTSQVKLPSHINNKVVYLATVNWDFVWLFF